MLHILKIIHGYPPKYNAGSEVYSQSICNELSKFCRVSIFTREENSFAADFVIREDKESDNRIKYFVNIPRGKDGYRHSQLDKNFGKLLDNIRPDIAHIGHLNHLSTGIIDELNQRNIPIVFTLHDFWLMCPRGQFLQTNFGAEQFYQLCKGQEDQKCAQNCYKAYFSGKEEDFLKDLSHWGSWIHQRMEETKSFLKKVDLFIAPSKYLMEQFIYKFSMPKEKIFYLDYGFPLDHLKLPINHKSRDLIFGYIGTHIPAKGVNFLIQAFSLLKGKSELKIWGRNNGQNTDSLKFLAGAIPLNDKRIFWKNEYENSKIVEEVFSEIDVLVVPSIWGENSPLVIHEAQACKIPVITANYGGMKEYVQHKVNGLLFEHRNVNDLAMQMQYALEHPEEMSMLGQRGYLFSPDEKVPDIKDHCKILMNIYQSLLRK